MMNDEYAGCFIRGQQTVSGIWQPFWSLRCRYSFFSPPNFGVWPIHISFWCEGITFLKFFFFFYQSLLCLSVCPPLCLSDCLYLSVCPPFCLSDCLYLSLVSLPPLSLSLHIYKYIHCHYDLIGLIRYLIQYLKLFTGIVLQILYHFVFMSFCWSTWYFVHIYSAFNDGFKETFLAYNVTIISFLCLSVFFLYNVPIISVSFPIVQPQLEAKWLSSILFGITVFVSLSVQLNLYTLLRADFTVITLKKFTSVLHCLFHCRFWFLFYVLLYCSYHH